MLFYILLAAICVLAAIVCLWLLRNLTSASKGFGHGLLPSLSWLSGRRHRRLERLSHLNNDLDGASPSPWGWGRGRATATRTHAGQPATKTPWGWAGNGRRDDSSLTGWPYRSGSMAGSSSRQSGFAGNGRKKNSKPWGW